MSMSTMSMGSKGTHLKDKFLVRNFMTFCIALMKKTRDRR